MASIPPPRGKGRKTNGLQHGIYWATHSLRRYLVYKNIMSSRIKRGPKHPQAPTYAQTAAGAIIPVTQASAPTLTQVMAVPDVKSQIISQLQSLTVLMQQVL